MISCTFCNTEHDANVGSKSEEKLFRVVDVAEVPVSQGRRYKHVIPLPKGKMYFCNPRCYSSFKKPFGCKWDESMQKWYEKKDPANLEVHKRTIMGHNGLKQAGDSSDGPC